MTGVMLALPSSGDVGTWTEDQRALLDFAGLVIRKGNADPRFAPRPVVVAFLQQCERTGLDPVARQIYAIERGGKWGVQVSIDGMRLVAQRSREYAGQGPLQWTADGVRWVDVWLDAAPPAAARATVYRRGFDVPMVAVARWDSYRVTVPRWENGQKVGERLAPMWERMPDLMLGKVAEALALRRAFPMELSGLYAEEETEFEAIEVEPVTRRAAVPGGPVIGSGSRVARREPLDEVDVVDAEPVVSEPDGEQVDAGSGDPLGLTPEERAEYGLDDEEATS